MVEWTTFRPQKVYLLKYVYGYLTQGHEGNNDYVRMNSAATDIIRQGVAVYATRRLQGATTMPCATTEQGASIHTYQPTTPCRLPCSDDHNTVIFADASVTTSLTPAAWRGTFGVEDRRDRPTAPTPPHRGNHLQGLLSRGTENTGGHRGRRQLHPPATA